jgi:hypothetical protein
VVVVYMGFLAAIEQMKLLTECSLKLVHMVLNIVPLLWLSLLGSTFTEQHDIERPSILVNPMITLEIILQRLL